MKTSKVVKCLPILLEDGITQKTWTGQYGTMHEFHIDFENGDGGIYSAKDPTQPKFKVGEESEYEITEGAARQDGTKFPSKIKAVSQQKAGGFTQRQSDPKSFALSYAKDYVIAMAGSNISEEAKLESCGQILKIADIFHKYMTDGYSDTLNTEWASLKLPF